MHMVDEPAAILGWLVPLHRQARKSGPHVEGEPVLDTTVLDPADASLNPQLSVNPVIEQAKGILMVWCRCGADAAFDLLRGASQRSNVKVSVLAASLVEQVSSPLGDGNGLAVMIMESSGVSRPGT